jgi:predicted regulator of Ras-like GTPase activity (Roadblock/LC7/MglB family)
MANKNTAQLRQEYGQMLREELELLAAANAGILAAQVCTSDGFEVASTRRSGESHRRLAAMVSSMQALGAAVVEESQLGDYRNLIIEGTQGKCIMMALPGTGGDLLLTVIADSEMLFGLFLVLSRDTCQAMSARLSATSQDD